MAEFKKITEPVDDIVTFVELSNGLTLEVGNTYVLPTALNTPNLTLPDPSTCSVGNFIEIFMPGEDKSISVYNLIPDEPMIFSTNIVSYGATLAGATRVTFMVQIINTIKKWVCIDETIKEPTRIYYPEAATLQLMPFDVAATDTYLRMFGSSGWEISTDGATYSELYPDDGSINELTIFVNTTLTTPSGTAKKLYFDCRNIDNVSTMYQRILIMDLQAVLIAELANAFTIEKAGGSTLKLLVDKATNGEATTIKTINQGKIVVTMEFVRQGSNLQLIAGYPNVGIVVTPS